MRSWIFVPGHSKKMVDKSFGFAVDGVMLDLEDGVVPALKAEARALVAAAVRQSAGRAGPLRYVRINGFGTGEFGPDLEAIVGDGLQGLVVPKVESAEEVRELDARLGELERAAGIPPGHVRLMLAIESAAGLVGAPALAASPRVSGLMFGAEDFSRDLGLPTVRTGAARDFIYARSAIVVAAAAARIWSIDGVWPDLSDLAGLEHDCRLARGLGFSGKSMIHPGQAETVNRVFHPSEDEVRYAQRLIDDFEAAQAQGQGSIRFEGMLVDRPIYERARRTVRLATSVDRAPANKEPRA